jgi:hypothetical protein
VGERWLSAARSMLSPGSPCDWNAARLQVRRCGGAALAWLKSATAGLKGESPAQASISLATVLAGHGGEAPLIGNASSMKIRFYIDPQTGQPHINDHQVECWEAEEVLQASGEDRPGRDGTRIAIGQASNGRYLKIVYVRDTRDSSLFVITGYQLERKPLAAYKRRRRKRK